MDLEPDRPIKQLAESPAKTYLLCIPAYNYARFVSPVLLSHCSPVYNAYLKFNGVFATSRCSHCYREHTKQRFCLSAVYTPDELDFLLDFLELTPQSIFSPSWFLSLLRLCDFLLLPQVLIFYLIQLYIPRHIRHRCLYTEALVEVLNSTSYSALGACFVRTYFHDWFVRRSWSIHFPFFVC